MLGISSSTFFYVLTVVSFVCSAHLPDNFKRCKANDPKISECLRVNVLDGLIQLKDGLPSLGVLSLEPLHIDSIDIPAGNGPVNFNQKYSNLKMIGITTSVFDAYKADLKNHHLHTEAMTPSLQLVGDYTVDGRVLVLPITGKGPANITLSEVKTIHDLYFEPFEKNGKSYLRCTEYKIQFIPKRVYFKLDNLFNGDARLGKQMNDFMNENWEEIMKELNPQYEEAFGLIFQDITNKIFTKVPTNEIFPPS